MKTNFTTILLSSLAIVGLISMMSGCSGESPGKTDGQVEKKMLALEEKIAALEAKLEKQRQVIPRSVKKESQSQGIPEKVVATSGPALRNSNSFEYSWMHHLEFIDDGLYGGDYMLRIAVKVYDKSNSGMRITPINFTAAYQSGKIVEPLYPIVGFSANTGNWDDSRLHGMNISPGGSEFVYYQTPIKSYRITGFIVNYKDWNNKQIPLVSNQHPSDKHWNRGPGFFGNGIRSHRRK